MVCSASKTKLLVVSTKELRDSKLQGVDVSVKVDDKFIHESSHEKLLGITMSNNMSWNVFLYGSKNDAGTYRSEGLMSQLSKRIGMIKAVSKYMNRSQLNSVINGLFVSKLLYCLPLFVNAWGIASLDETYRRCSTFAKEDMRRLQVLQNKVLRIKCQNYDINTPTVDLLNSCGDMSVHQLGVFHTLLQVFNIVHSGQPEYLAKKLQLRKPKDEYVFPQRQINTIDVRGYLTLSRSGFVYRGAQLWNSLPTDMRQQSEYKAFKIELRQWVNINVPVKPQ